MNSDEPNLILPKFSRRLYFFFSSALWHLQKLIFSDENGQWFCILLCNFFTSKRYRSNCRSRWENLDRGQYPFQPIKFVNLVVPSPCETEPDNKASYKERLDQSDCWKRFVQLWNYTKKHILVGYKMIIANSELLASLPFFHFIFKVHSWKCYLSLYLPDFLVLHYCNCKACQK